MEKPKRPRGRPTAASKAKYEAELKAFDEARSNAFVEAKLQAPFAKRKTHLKPDDETLQTIFEFAKLDCPQREIAAVLHVSEYQLVQFMKDHPQAREAWEDGREFHKIILRADQVELSKKNAVMGIFRGKNKLGQKDVSETNVNVNTSVSEMTQEQLMEIAFGSGAAPKTAKPHQKTKH